MPIKSFALAAATLVAIGCGSAGAQNATEEAEYRRDCTSDYTRLCSAYSPGSAEVSQCFTQRFKELSPRCQATIRKYSRAQRGR